MGGKGSKRKDVGYDWWRLVEAREREALQSLVDRRPETCVQLDRWVSE